MPFIVHSPLLMLSALAVAALLAVIAFFRRAALPASSGVLFGIGLLCLAAAAGGIEWKRPRQGRVAVMVDLSGSTRGAAYRDRGALERRTGELLGRTPHRITYFAETSASSVSGEELGDLPGDRTRFAAPPVDAVVLFSDGQFQIPESAPPTYVVVDAKLNDPPDAAIRDLELRGETIAASVANSDSSRELRFENAMPASMNVRRGDYTVAAKIEPRTGRVKVSFAPTTQASDLWPENDSLSLNRPLPETRERWWVGATSASGLWRTIAPGELPTDPAAYLRPAVIVLDDVSADALSAVQLDRVAQYVRDLGGGLVILGSEHAYAPGNYPGTPLESLSPLSSDPPAPVTHWIVLVDSSGSMNETTGETTRWQAATMALRSVLPSLPPEDLASLGSFAKDVKWWAQSRSARELVSMSFPPREIVPTGPTNIAQALAQLNSTGAAAGSGRTEIVLITDADAKIDDPAALATAMQQAKARLHLLSLQEAPADNPVRRIVERTGGIFLNESNSTQWARALRQLLRAAAPDRIVRQAVTPVFTEDLATLSSSAVAPWIRTWTKHDAREIATTRWNSETAPLIAKWNFGPGKVIAAVYRPEFSLTQKLTELAESPPRDPRFKIGWKSGPNLEVSVDAASDGAFINNMPLELVLIPAAGGAIETRAIAQVAPGRYEIVIPAPRDAALALVRLKGQVLDRRAIASRYAPEFDHIGNNRSAMIELARRSGGGVIEPEQSKPIDFRWPIRLIPLTPWLAIAGAIALGAGLVRWRRA